MVCGVWCAVCGVRCVVVCGVWWCGGVWCGVWVVCGWCGVWSGLVISRECGAGGGVVCVWGVWLACCMWAGVVCVVCGGRVGGHARRPSSRPCHALNNSGHLVRELPPTLTCSSTSTLDSASAMWPGVVPGGFPCEVGLGRPAFPAPSLMCFCADQHVRNYKAAVDTGCPTQA